MRVLFFAVPLGGLVTPAIKYIAKLRDICTYRLATGRWVPATEVQP